MKDEIRNLQTLVDVVAALVSEEIKQGSDKTLKELLWTVPTRILADYAKK